MRPRVVIVQETLPHYRVALFDAIAARAAEVGVDVVVAHGEATGARRRRLGAGVVGAGVAVRNRQVPIPGRPPLVWQPVLRRCLAADLVVVEQANRMLLNYLLLAAQRLGGPPVAFWGHGRNLQARPGTWSEQVKRWMLHRPAWWFAYTSGVKQYLVEAGVAADRITDVGNTIDVLGLRAQIEHERSAGAVRRRMRCAYLGGLYRHKLLDLLFAAADLIRRDVPDFELVIAGDGEERDVVERFAVTRPWATYRGTVTGAERACLLAEAGLLLIPGLVGLVVLDAFAAGIPLVTTADAQHSPEIEYLEDGVNGVVVPAGTGAEGYATAVAALLNDPDRWARLQRGAHAAAEGRTVEAAADRFVAGLTDALSRRRTP